MNFTLHVKETHGVILYRMKCLWALILLAASMPLTAGEFAVLASGQRMRAERHEQSGQMIRLFYQGGVTEIPASLVAGFEEFADPPAPVAEKPVEAPAPQIALAPAPVPPVSTDPKVLIRDAAEKVGLPASFIESVAKAESAFRQDAVSPKGAIGVMQLMPGTAEKLGADPYDVQQNIDAGTRLLRDLLAKYNGDVVKALSAYNAGEGAVDKYHGLPPYTETRQYVNRVIKYYQQAGGQ